MKVKATEKYFKLYLENFLLNLWETSLPFSKIIYHNIYETSMKFETFVLELKFSLLCIVCDRILRKKFSL